MIENTIKEQDLYLAQETTTVGNGVTIGSDDVSNVAMTAAAGGSGTWNATPLTLGQWMTSELCCPEQEHWYSFIANNTTVQSDGTTNWYRIQGGGSENLVGRLYNASGHLIGFSDSGLSFDMTIQLTHGAKYYVCITYNSSVRSVYDLRVKAVAAPSSAGGDICDEFASAMPLTLNAWKSGNIYVAGSSVYYRFVPSATAYYTIETSGSVDTVGYLFDATGNQLTSNDDGGSTGYNFRMSYQLVAGRSYYIRVTGYGTSVGGFSIVVKGTVYVSSVTVSPSVATLNVGQTRTLTATVYPSYAMNKSYVWSSDNTSVATVSSSGVVTALGGGTATIYATAQDGSGAFGYCHITVPIHVTSISVSTAATMLCVGQSYTPTVTVYPHNATNKTVTWISCDPSIATVDYYSGCITACAAGTTTIIATSSDGSYTDSIQVTVKIDTVTIMHCDRFNTNKVVFNSTGKTWYCLNSDRIYDELGKSDGYLEELLKLNFWDGYQNTFFDLDPSSKPITYTDDEIRLLYAIDPHGVAAYVQWFADKKEGLSKTLQEKDRVFRLLFNREPKYYSRKSENEWEIAEDTSNLQAVVSESEAVFGMHPVWDDYTMEQLTEAIFNAAIAIAISFLEKIPNLSNYIKVYNTIASVVSVLTYSICVDDIVEDGVIELLDNTNNKWAAEMVSKYISIRDIVLDFMIQPAFYNEIFDYCSNTGYTVDLKLINGQSYTLEQIQAASE